MIHTSYLRLLLIQESRFNNLSACLVWTKSVASEYSGFRNRSQLWFPSPCIPLQCFLIYFPSPCTPLMYFPFLVYADHLISKSFLIRRLARLDSLYCLYECHHTSHTSEFFKVYFLCTKLGIIGTE